ncbi:MAG: membrane dipeptidase [Myxococcota bacterium]
MVSADYVITDEERFGTDAGVSRDAVALLRSSEVVDLHVESFIPPRLFGYDLHRRHAKRGPLRGHFFGHLDFPRALDAGLTGAMWSISTNIARSASSRLRVFRSNVDRLKAEIEATGGRMRVVHDFAEYKHARAEGVHAALLSVQGGNCYEAASEGPAVIADNSILRVTVVHLSNSCYGATSSPLSFLKGAEGMTTAGREFVERLNEKRIFVDLAHINVPGFWDAMEVHDKTQPVLVTHTGVTGVKDMWRNINDDQIRAVADTGGVVGVIFQAGFLTRSGGPRDGRMVVEHMSHVVDVVGEDFVAIGSDYDGAIIPPADLRNGTFGYVRLVQYMLDAGWSDTRIRKVLGLNFLRSFKMLRPGNES